MALGEKGFSLIELMVVIAIVGILASIAMPQYKQYTRAAAFVELKLAAGTIRKQIDMCYALNDGAGPENACNRLPTSAVEVRGQTTNQILSRASNPQGVATITLTPGPSPTITVLPTAQNGILASDSYILTGSPNIDNTSINKWNEAGIACVKGYC